ncbi:MAG: amino acid permease [Deltaproteobacteria bacterium]|nr:amino acid permease [Deltaproteobacteria bacterium]
MAVDFKANFPNDTTGTRLARELGLGAALSIGIGTMVCAGIFVLPGIAAAKAGPIVVFAFSLCGLVAILIATCMAELSTGMPLAGGGYLFVVRAFGPMLGAVMGWCLWLSLIFASAFYMVGFGYYVADVVGISHVVLALTMTILLTGLNYIGAKETGGTQNVIVAGLLIVLLVFFLRAVFDVDMDNLRPLVPPEIGISGFLMVTPVLFITFMGFAEIAAVSEEIKDPARNLPLALVGSVIVVTLIYCAVEFCVVGLLRYDDPTMMRETVLIELARMLMGRTGYALVMLGGIFATVSSANASIMAASRISFAMGRDRLMPDWFNQIHLRFKTPYRSIVVTGGLTLILLMILGSHLELIAEVGAFLSLLLYAFISLACMVMRHAGPDWYRPTFRTPFYPFVPVMGLLGCLFVMGITSRPTILIGLAIIAGTLIWYVLVLRGQTQLVGASNALWQQKVIGPLVARAEDYMAARREAFPVILVPLANPETERSLMIVGTALARARRARLHLVHVMSVPMQTPLEACRIEFDQMRPKQETLLDVALRRAVEQGIRARADALCAHNVPSAILSITDMEHPDLILMGWRGEVRDPRTHRTNVAGVLKVADRNVLVLKDNGLNDVRRILVPIGSGPHSKLGLRVAHELAGEWGATITAMTVQVGRGYSAARSDFDRESLEFFQGLAKEFVRDALAEAGITADISAVIDTDVGQAIITAAADHDLIIIGASNDWALRQWLFGSLPDYVANHASASVLMVRSRD